jgi:retinol dehydrogenase-12
VSLPGSGLSGKVCIVTGASSGIGEVSARELARANASLAIVCRNRSRGEAVLERIAEETGNRDLELFVADLESQAQIRRVSAELLTRYSRIDVLLNNAGVTNLRRSTTVDGIETVFAVNHLASFLLTGLLLDRILATPHSRIVNVASDAYKFGRIDFDDLGHEQSYRWMRVYGQSKLANILFTQELARRIEGSGTTVNALHPGGVSTGLGSNNGGLLHKLVMGLLKPFMKTPEQGAQTSLFLATSPDVAASSGQYYNNCRVAQLPQEARDAETARRLWQVSETMTQEGQ